jgi:hypothetical protein
VATVTYNGHETGRAVVDTKKLELQLDTWRRDLIDLSRRNSLLNLSGRAASLSLVEPGFEQMLLMVMKGRPLSLQDAPDLEVASDDVESTSEELPLAPNALRPGSRSGKNARAVLRTLKRRADQEFLDKGIRIAYVAFGTLNWDDRGDAWSSPFLMAPIELGKNAAGDFTITLSDEEDPVVNPALLEKLREILDVPVLVEDVRAKNGASDFTWEDQISFLWSAEGVEVGLDGRDDLLWEVNRSCSSSGLWWPDVVLAVGHVLNSSFNAHFAVDEVEVLTL